MKDESAAGRKTDQGGARQERLAAALEEQFHVCRREADFWLNRNRTEEGHLRHGALDDLLKLVRMNAQLAGVIARIDAAKNRNSNTQ